MTVGDGIFYSVLLISFVALYIATRDRWNWRKIVFRLFGGVIGILVIGGSALYLYDIYEELPRKETSFWGIQLGISKSDVRFLKGNPSPRPAMDAAGGKMPLTAAERAELQSLRKEFAPAPKIDLRNLLDDELIELQRRVESKRTEPDLSEQLPGRDAPAGNWWAAAPLILPGSHEDVWSFYLNEKSESEGVYVVSFKGGKVDAVQYIGPPLNAASIQGISGYGDYATIKERFGEPTLISRSEDDTARMLSYAQYNLVFILRKSAIESLGIFDGARRAGIQFKNEEK